MAINVVIFYQGNPYPMKIENQLPILLGSWNSKASSKAKDLHNNLPRRSLNSWSNYARKLEITTTVFSPGLTSRTNL
jgi:hypothetical protein